MTKPFLALLGILSVTFAAATEFVVYVAYEWSFLSDPTFIPLIANLSGVLSTLGWWIGVVLIGFATMVRDRRALQLPSPEPRNPSSP